MDGLPGRRWWEDDGVGSWRCTYRVVDGARIEGTWRPAFIWNGGTYYLTDLLIYADGKVDCWGLVGFGGVLREGP